MLKCQFARQSILHYRTLLHCHFQIQCRRVMVVTISMYDNKSMGKLRILKYVQYIIKRIFANF